MNLKLRTCNYTISVHGESNYFFNYNTYGVTCAEVEIDVLTGETEVLRVDILYDCGER